MKSLILLALSIFMILSFSSLYAQTNNNQNSLVACVDHFMNIYNNTLNSMTEEQKQNITKDVFKNPQSMEMVTTKACMLSYEHKGKYLNLLPIEEQSKYVELAAKTIFLEGLSAFLNK